MRHGRLEDPRPSAIERILGSYAVDSETGCWMWTGCVGANGYGRIRVDGSDDYAHRVSYRTFIGPIPDGLTIDHLCRTRTCINPTHLEPVTRAENSRREAAAQKEGQPA